MSAFNCLNCGKEKRRTSSSLNKYCSNQCQKDFQTSLKLAEVEAGTASHRWVKRYLIEKHGQICMDINCAWDFNKRPIGVELEHKDGNSENNTLENCILLCPNCHSQTSTYKNKNKGNGRAERRARYKAGLSY